MTKIIDLSIEVTPDNYHTFRNADKYALPLSDRQTEIVALMLKGLSNQQIADELFISVNTVKNQMSNIYDKLNINTDRQLFAAYINNDISLEVSTITK